MKNIACLKFFSWMNPTLTPQSATSWLAFAPLPPLAINPPGPLALSQMLVTSLSVKSLQPLQVNRPCSCTAVAAAAGRLHVPVRKSAKTKAAPGASARGGMVDGSRI